MANQQLNKIKYTIQIADNALVIGHRISEWCGHGPILEQDIAITNISLDHLGQARSLYQYAAQQFNELSNDDQKDFFSSPLLQQVTTAIDEDDLAYLRDVWDYRNVLLCEQPNGDWAVTVARSFFLDAFNYYFFTELKNSKDQTLAAIAEKSLKEVTYHLRWSSEWVIRLGDGTDQSHARMQKAVNEMWMYSGEVFKASEADIEMEKTGIAPTLEKLKTSWQSHIQSVFDEATIELPKNDWMQEGGKDGRHTEHLGYVLAEMQFLQRAYPNMEW